MLASNLCLLANRQSKEPFAVLCSRLLTERKIAAVYDASTSFPLYLYPPAGSEAITRDEAFEHIRHSMKQLGSMDEALTQAETAFAALYPGHPGRTYSRWPNVDPRFIVRIRDAVNLAYVTDGRGNLSESFGPEDIFNYIYAIFHSSGYRKRYAEFVKMDFPRVPLTRKRNLFRALCEFGAELVGFHLMEKVGPETARFPIKGSDEVGKARYTAPGQGSPEGRVWINETQFFEGVPPHVWEFHIGGYQVCEKWLKDRKGRRLSFDDKVHYQHIVSALSETIRLMTEIDSTIDAHGGWPLG